MCLVSKEVEVDDSSSWGLVSLYCGVTCLFTEGILKNFTNFSSVKFWKNYSITISTMKHCGLPARTNLIPSFIESEIPHRIDLFVCLSGHYHNHAPTEPWQLSYRIDLFEGFWNLTVKMNNVRLVSKVVGVDDSSSWGLVSPYWGVTCPSPRVNTKVSF
jgi:hypothetical protein